jgi:hypothetical protein
MIGGAPFVPTGSEGNGAQGGCIPSDKGDGRDERENGLDITPLAWYTET